MKAYVVTTGTLFGLLVVAHVWRVLEEGAHVAASPMFLVTTILALGVCLWACWLLRGSRRV